MKLPNFIKSKGFKIYVAIGVLFYIIPYLFGITNAVRIYLEQKTIFSDYIDEIKQVYINEDKDISMCVHGSTSGHFDIDYWIYIPYFYYEFSERNFRNSMTGLSSIPHEFIKISDCDKSPWLENKFSVFDINILQPKFDYYIPFNKIFDYEEFQVDVDTMFLVKYKDEGRYYTKIALVRLLNKESKTGLSLNMSEVNYRGQLNRLWKLLYIPAFILDVLLWPLYLLLLLYSTFIAPSPR